MLNTRGALLAFAFIILIYLVVLYGADYPVAAIGMATICMLIVGSYLLNPQAVEKMTENVGGPVDTDLVQGDTPLADEDQYIGKYQNVRTGDLDNMLQRNYSMDFAKQSDGSYQTSDEIDNSDAVEEAITRGNTVFQPSMQGVSATSSAMLSSFNLAEPGPMPEYKIPLNNRATTVDESVSRKQQHRGAMNKKAIDGVVRNTKNAYQRCFLNELDENYHKDWWSAESHDVETDFMPPY
jgi:hypothetical protein